MPEASERVPSDEELVQYNERAKTAGPFGPAGQDSPVSDANLFEMLQAIPSREFPKALAFVMAPPPGFRKKPEAPFPTKPAELLAEWFALYDLFLAAFIPPLDDRRDDEAIVNREPADREWKDIRERAWPRMRRLSDALGQSELIQTPEERAPVVEISGYPAWNLVPADLWDAALRVCKCLQPRQRIESLEKDPPADSVAHDAPNDEDGPVPPDGFRWKGTVFRSLAKRPFLALAEAWDRELNCVYAEDLAAAFGDPEEPVDGNAMRGIRSRLNEFFSAHGIQLHAKVNDHYLSIENGLPRNNRRAKAADSKRTRRPKHR